MKRRILLLLFLALFCTSCESQSISTNQANHNPVRQEKNEIPQSIETWQDFNVQHGTETGTNSELTSESMGNDKYEPKSEESTEMNKVQITDYFTGTWINELGFVCEYGEENFIDQFGNTYEDCEITNYENTDFYILQCNDDVDSQIHKFVIQVIDEDTIELNTVTAYRCSCEKGLKYSVALKQKIIGSWLYHGEEDEQLLEFTKDELITVDGEYEERTPYEICDGKLYVHLGDEDIMTIYIQLYNNELTLKEGGESLLTYRH